MVFFPPKALRSVSDSILCHLFPLGFSLDLIGALRLVGYSHTSGLSVHGDNTPLCEYRLSISKNAPYASNSFELSTFL